MVYLCSWFSVCALETLVADSGQVHVRPLLSDLDSLELSIMEIVAIINVFALSWVQIILELSEIIFAKLGLSLCSEAILD